MMKIGLVQVVLSCCAGVGIFGGACSTADDEGRRAGTGGMGAVAGSAVAGSATGGRAGGSATGGRAGGSATGGRAGGGTAGGGNGGTGVAGSGGQPEGGTSGGGGHGPCEEEITHGLIQRTLTEYCQHPDHDCPATLEAARSNVRECREGQFSEERTGCGFTVVGYYAGDFGRAFVFEGALLVGAYSFDDIIRPPCDTTGEVGGVYPPTCANTDSCRICDQEDGSAGEGPFCDFGPGGAGGEGGR